MKSTSKAYSWVPTLYVAEAVPYAVVMTLSTIIYKNMGMSNTDLALYTSLLYLPWTIKPLWSPLVDSLNTKKWWIIITQFIISLSLFGVAFTLTTNFWVIGTLIFFWIMAFSSATHDISADGFYILALNSHDQAFYVGIRNTFYRLGNMLVQGMFVILYAWFFAGAPLWSGEKLIPALDSYVSGSWCVVLCIMAVMFMLFSGWHKYILYSANDVKVDNGLTIKDNINKTLSEFVHTVNVFIHKPQIIYAVLFMLLFRFPEAQLGKMASPFMLDSLAKGGLGLDTGTVGVAYGTIGIIGLITGGILGGIAVSKHGLKKWMWPMVMFISLPDAVYIYLSYSQCQDLLLINSCVFIEQFGYGFGFTAYTLYLVYFAKGENSTSVYAICTGLMALGMMLPGMFAGKLCDLLGYKHFFVWIMFCCIITVLVTLFVKVDENYGRKEELADKLD